MAQPPAAQKQPWETLAEAFVTQFYNTFDANRAQAIQFYHPEAWMQFEEHKGRGHAEINVILTEKLTFQRIEHKVTKLDCQPTTENGVVIVVTGRLKTDDDPIHAFNETFYLRPYNDNFYLYHDIFRLSIHDSAS